MPVELTRDAKDLLKALYNAYQDRIADGVKKDTAKYFSDAQAIYDTVYAQQDFDDLVETIRELSRAGMLSVSWYDNTAYCCRLTDEAIKYMENRFKSAAKDVAKCLAEGAVGALTNGLKC